MRSKPLNGSAGGPLRVGLLTLDLDSREVAVRGRILPLTGKEFDVLALLVRRQGRVITKEGILHRIYGGIDEPRIATIRVFICKLRKKLALVYAGIMIATAGGGYMIAADPNAPDGDLPGSIVPRPEPRRGDLSQAV